MRLCLAFLGLLAGCLAQAPRSCRSPPYLTGSFTVAIEKGQIYSSAKYEYDREGERLWISEIGYYGNNSFTYDALLLYKENAIYVLDQQKQSCVKKNLTQKFQPIGIPRGSTLVSQSILGSSSRAGEGLLVNTWMNNLPNNEGKSFVTVTQYGCIPVSILFYTEESGWGEVVFSNNIIGIGDPNELNPPSYCQGVKEPAANDESVDFFSLFHKKH